MADRALMSFEVGKKALDFLVANSGSRSESGGGFLRRRTADELAGGQGSGGLWQKPGEAS